MGIYNARYLAYLVKLAAASAAAAVTGYTFEAPLYIRLVKVDGAALEATEYYKARARTFLDCFADVMVLVQPDCVLSPADQARLAGLMADPDLEVVMHGWYDVTGVSTTYGIDGPYQPRVIEDATSLPEVPEMPLTPSQEELAQYSAEELRLYQDEGIVRLRL